MRILLSNPRGFCAGVAMAVEVVDRLTNLIDGPIYVFHDIVHNTHVVSRLEAKGVIFTEDIPSIPPNSVLVFSAHGVSPKIREAAANRNLRTIDATCPLVTKVHAEAVRYANLGLEILLIGHADHQEVIGTHGEAPESIRIVESEDDAKSVSVQDPSNLVYLTQTTLSTDDAEKIISILQERFPLIKGPPGEDICYATTNRQGVVAAYAKSVDRVLVIGSSNSSNSVRLAEIAENRGTPACRIDDLRELKDDFVMGAESVLVTAGASAPEDLVQQVISHFVTLYKADIEVIDAPGEGMKFPLPRSMRKIMKENDAEIPRGGISVDADGKTRDWMTQSQIPFISITAEGHSI